VVFAAVDRGAAGAGGYARFVQHRQRLMLLQSALELTQLRIDLGEGAQLGEHERVVALAEAVQIEDKAPEVAVGELAGLAEEANTSAHAPARSESACPAILAGVRRLVWLLLTGLGLVRAAGVLTPADGGL
jgi:hypothetical protein